MTELNASCTGLCVSNCRTGSCRFPAGPHSANDVVARAALLAEKCRANGSPVVVMVRIASSADYAGALK